MTDAQLDELERLAKEIMAGPRATGHTDPVIRNMGRLEFDSLCRQYTNRTNPAAILALIAEVRELRRDAESWRAHMREVERVQDLERRGFGRDGALAQGEED